MRTVMQLRRKRVGQADIDVKRKFAIYLIRQTALVTRERNFLITIFTFFRNAKRQGDTGRKMSRISF